MLREETDERPADVLSLNIVSSRGRTIRPKTLNQKRYVDAIDDHTIVFGIGPAGTGKTYLAMAKAVQALQSKAVNRIILTRPAVEAGERLGFLPGTLYEKIDPYLRPLYDALHDMIDPDSIPRLMASGVIEVAPLAFMRGRAQPVDTPGADAAGLPADRRRCGSAIWWSARTACRRPCSGSIRRAARRSSGSRPRTARRRWPAREHLWFVTTPDDRRHGTAGRVLETREMIGNLRQAHQRRYELPLVNPVEFEPRDVPMDPYALGLLLGDGCITDTTDAELRHRRPGARRGARTGAAGRRAAPRSRRSTTS